MDLSPILGGIIFLLAIKNRLVGHAFVVHLMTSCHLVGHVFDDHLIIIVI